MGWGTASGHSIRLISKYSLSVYLFPFSCLSLLASFHLFLSLIHSDAMLKCYSFLCLLLTFQDARTCYRLLYLYDRLRIGSISVANWATPKIFHSILIKTFSNIKILFLRIFQLQTKASQIHNSCSPIHHTLGVSKFGTLFFIHTTTNLCSRITFIPILKRFDSLSPSPGMLWISALSL